MSPWVCIDSIWYWAIALSWGNLEGPIISDFACLLTNTYGSMWHVWLKNGSIWQLYGNWRNLCSSWMDRRCPELYLKRLADLKCWTMNCGWAVIPILENSPLEMWNCGPVGNNRCSYGGCIKRAFWRREVLWNYRSIKYVFVSQYVSVIYVSVPSADSIFLSTSLPTATITPPFFHMRRSTEARLLHIHHCEM